MIDLPEYRWIRRASWISLATATLVAGLAIFDLPSPISLGIIGGLIAGAVWGFFAGMRAGILAEGGRVISYLTEIRSLPRDDWMSLDDVPSRPDLGSGPCPFAERGEP